MGELGEKELNSAIQLLWLTPYTVDTVYTVLFCLESALQ